MSEIVEDDRVVAIYYTLKNAEGAQLDSNKGGKPLVYLHGKSQIVPGLEKELAGQKRGATVNVVVPAEGGYGEPKEELFETVPRSSFPPEMELAVGQMLQGQNPEGQAVRIRIHELKDDEVIVDKNHPLAGQPLHFEVHIYGVREATKEELEHGHAHGPGGHKH